MNKLIFGFRSVKAVPPQMWLPVVENSLPGKARRCEDEPETELLFFFRCKIKHFFSTMKEIKLLYNNVNQ